MAREFPALASALARPESRRRVLRLMAASMALGGLAGMRPERAGQRLMSSRSGRPPISCPDSRTATRPRWWTAAPRRASSSPTRWAGRSRSRAIRSTPRSLGATSIHGQAVLLDFYDPDRSSGLMHAGRLASAQALEADLLGQRARLAQTQGDGFRILTGRIVSPTLGAAMDSPAAALPEGGVASVGAGVARQRPRAAASWHTAGRSTCCRACRCRGRGPGTGQRPDQRRARPSPLRAGDRIAAQSGAGAHEPDLRGRAAADADRRRRRSSVRRRAAGDARGAAGARRDRARRRRAGRGAALDRRRRRGSGVGRPASARARRPRSAGGGACACTSGQRAARRPRNHVRSHRPDRGPTGGRRRRHGAAAGRDAVRRGADAADPGRQPCLHAAWLSRGAAPRAVQPRRRDLRRRNRRRRHLVRAARAPVRDVGRCARARRDDHAATAAIAAAVRRPQRVRGGGDVRGRRPDRRQEPAARGVARPAR